MSSILTGILGSKGAKKAAAQQAQYLNKALDQQNQQYQQSRADFEPYRSFGGGALASLGDLLGLNGNDAQGVAYDALKGSPAFTSRYDTGLDAINQSAAATGGLRGGNNALAESNFGASLLDQVIGNQTNSLFNAAGIGSGTVTSLANLGQQNSNANSALLSGIGNAKASGTLGASNAWINSINDFQKQLMQAFSGGGGF